MGLDGLVLTDRLGESNGHAVRGGPLVAYTTQGCSLKESGKDGWLVYTDYITLVEYRFPVPKGSDLDRFRLTLDSKNVLIAVAHGLGADGRPSFDIGRSDARGWEFAINDMGNMFAMQIPEESGWHLGDKFGLGLPVGRKAKESDPRARFLSRHYLLWVGLPMRWNDREDDEKMRTVDMSKINRPSLPTYALALGPEAATAGS
ncbi:MAG: hypothetical protein NT157_06300 [Candidatus Micrarchaeota archaeon]|nr:hypothetical protein [Candidatus Micrarchaeota archaeon]